MDNYKTITQVNNYIKYLLDTNKHLQGILIKGEISNFKNHTRGHLYFTLKDNNSRLNAVMFSSSAAKLKFTPEDGMNVLIKGRISSYVQQGSYQIYVDEMDLDGVGNLYIEFEKLKEKLYKEGLFDEGHKKKIPKYPTKIGVVTAPTGAAVRDIMSTIKRRYSMAQVILFPSLVQGDSAKDDIVRQIKRADEYGLDVLIVGRGGGSIEDLWPFNEEVVARCIYDAKTPIISAVGHEPDFTIADFVADLRAPTPTGAAEMCVPTNLEINTYINQLRLRLDRNIKNIINKKYIELKSISKSHILSNPLIMYQEKEQRLDNYMDLLIRNMNKLLDDKKYTLNILSNKVINKSPVNICNINMNKLNNYINIINKDILKIIDNKKYKIDYIINTLKLTNPLNILDNGYSVVKFNNKTIKSIKDIEVGANIDIRLSDGNISAIVKEKNDGK